MTKKSPSTQEVTAKAESNSGSQSAPKPTHKFKTKKSRSQQYFAKSYGTRRNDCLDPFLKRPSTPSRLSRGPRDPLHRHSIYRKNDRSVWNVIDQMIAQRTMGMRIWHVCYLAAISSPTFYLHFRSIDNARKQYEEHVRSDFHRNISQNLKRETLFGLFLVYMQKHRSYFQATFKGDDTLVLRQLLNHFRPMLAGKNIDDRSYAVYVHTLIGILYCWYKHDRMSSESQEFYARQLVRQRIMQV